MIVNLVLCVLMSALQFTLCGKPTFNSTLKKSCLEKGAGWWGRGVLNKVLHFLCRVLMIQGSFAYSGIGSPDCHMCHCLTILRRPMDIYTILSMPVKGNDQADQIQTENNFIIHNKCIK